ncbi:MAG: RICIN domain-containing protein, partial [Fimbriiglobus sp.]
ESHGGRHQQWAFVKVGEYYRVHNRASGKVLEVDPDHAKERGCGIRLGEYKRDAHQEWRVR